MSRAEMAMERLYGDESLTDELRDDEAKTLLSWGEAELNRLLAQDMDEETFDDRFKLLRRTMKRINSFVAKRQEYEADKAQNVMARFTEGAFELGYEISYEQMTTFLAQQSTLNNQETVQAMLALMTGKTQEGEEDGEEEQ